jgi:hypothetical protein
MWYFFGAEPRVMMPMRLTRSTAMVTLGLCLFCAYRIMHIFVRARLVNRGLLKNRWETVGSAVRMYRTYIGTAERYRWSTLPAYMAPVCLSLSIILIFWGVVSSPAR